MGLRNEHKSGERHCQKKSNTAKRCVSYRVSALMGVKESTVSTPLSALIDWLQGRREGGGEAREDRANLAKRGKRRVESVSEVR